MGPTLSESAVITGDALALRAGELVEVCGKDEILATLDERAELDGLAFMPEMLEFCGRQLRVFRRAHKTCDTITGDNVGRRMDNAVHLEGARCDGSAHGGCQAACLFFWKESWLKRVETARPSLTLRLLEGAGGSTPREGASQPPCTEETLQKMTVQEQASGSEEPAYRCQITRLLHATKPLPWWEPKQYFQDWLSGNVPLLVLLRTAFFRTFYQIVHFGRGYRLKVKLYNVFAKLLGEIPYPYESGQLIGKTPALRLDLQPGELVRVRPVEQILQTLNGRLNRGLGFSPEMVRYCGDTFRVRSRVSKIIDEKTGKMVHFGNECIILDDVICRSECASNRLFCPRSIFPYWREIWLERVDEKPESRPANPDSLDHEFPVGYSQGRP